MNTKRFKTRTEFIERANVKVPGVWHVGLDIGYSSVKAYHPNGISTFPYAAKKEPEISFAGKIPYDAIIYKDLDTNETWTVGEYALNSANPDDTNFSESILYGRDRTHTEMFKVIARTGIGIAMLPNAYGEPGNDRIEIQTGLPERYLDNGYKDKNDLISVLSGSQNFAIKVGKRNWEYFHININSDDIYVISQPKASLFGICINNEGKIVSKYRNLINENVVVFDPGFGTFDLFVLRKGQVLKGETFTDLGMHRVFEECSKLIEKNIEKHIPVYALQNYLDTGVIRTINFDADVIVPTDFEFDKLLAEASNKVCDEAIKRTINSIKDMLASGISAFIVTGGTGAAWIHNIEDKLGRTAPIIKGNENDNISFIYNNARGYYLYRYTKILKEG